MPLVTSGVEHGNLRELALARMKDLGTQVIAQLVFCVLSLSLSPFLSVVMLELERSVFKRFITKSDLMKLN